MRILLLRHGQAMHNPRAEAARASGCSHDTFMQLMKEDDVFDAPLTNLGSSQALVAAETHRDMLLQGGKKGEGIDLVVSSPLTRALRTADLLFPHLPTNNAERICLEEFREINGLLANARRRETSELQQTFPHWDFSRVPDGHDNAWSSESLEDFGVCAERGYTGLLRLIAERRRKNTERNCEVTGDGIKSDGDVMNGAMLVVSHGGILRFTMERHPLVNVTSDGARRFENCELREYEMTWVHGNNVNKSEGDSSWRPEITLTEITTTTVN